MKIAALRISGFRSFGPDSQTLTFDSTLNCFIGLNSSGKTAALDAIRKLFGDRIERTLFKEDFYTPAGEDPMHPSNKSLIIEVDLVFDENDPVLPLFEGQYTVENNQARPYVRIRQKASWQPSASSPEGEIEQKQSFVTLPGNVNNEEETKEFKKSMYGLFQVIYIPALRKTADQLKFASGSILHRLLKTINFDAGFRDNLRQQVGALNGLFSGLPGFDVIQGTIQETWSKFHRDDRFKDANMKFGTGEIDEVLKKLEIQFSPAPGVHRDFNIHDLGDGYRSLFYITMVCALLQVEAQQGMQDLDEDAVRPVVTLLLIEEPENHIAPQILGRVIRILEDIASHQGLMVFLSSHTPAIVKRLDPETIYHFRINNGQTQVRNIKLPDKQDEAYKYIKEAVRNYPEIYFAKVVLIGEGDSEAVIFNHLMNVLDFDFDDNIVTFAPLGHRFVHHIWKLLADLQIPHVTLLDLDLGRHIGGWGRIKYALLELIDAGHNRDQLLTTPSGILSEEQLNQMHARDYSENRIRALEFWIGRLQSLDVFYTRNLDLDFLMLKTFPAYYQGRHMYPTNGGPRIPRDGHDRAVYVEKSVVATLKHENYIADLYNVQDRELMVWYNYHFLGRGKPVTHMQALASMPDIVIKEKLPAVFNEIFVRIKEKLA
ncbi:ATP-dependent endonuclease [Chitinophaga sp. XS-30]|uniref:ATP-dependent nuclease n=1 Tax=Chitinophaga sp. XS-30 TaxID=2604421 RepID=UPI0011DDC634|nr:AAA family ATPase [Chitinophaga sp. XS-30]QEH41200.1 AAA family ATPase [Chitinophaga sp. XS-30]